VASDSTTVRVSVSTRARLAAQAGRRGVSIAKLIEELSVQAERQAAFAAERAATLADADSTAVHNEDHVWDIAADDGID